MCTEVEELVALRHSHRSGAFCGMRSKESNNMSITCSTLGDK